MYEWTLRFGEKYIYLARETLILQPPDKLFVGLSIIPIVNPRPARILLAFGSAASAPIARSSSYTFNRKC